MPSNRPQSSKDAFRRVRLALESLEQRDLPSSTLLTVDAPAADSSDYANDHILVRWLDNASSTAAPEGSTYLGNNTWSIRVDGSVTDTVAYYSQLAGIDFAQPDYLIRTTLTPDDTSYPGQWALNNTGQTGGLADADIDAPEAWNITTGSSSIIVAVIDTGVDYNHIDLRDNMWHNPGEVNGDGIDNDRNGIVDDYYGANFYGANTGNPLDDNGHGTHVAGTIGATGNNTTGVTGVAWDVQIMALKFITGGSGYTSDAVEAVYYAVNNGAKILSNSWGGGGYDSALASAIDYARSRGVIFVAAAGNYSSNNDLSPFYPSSYTANNVVSVASTDANDNLSSFSNYGATTVDLAAPGSSIYSTLPGDSYGTYSGTSMAAPHVSGALALVWSAHPTWSYSQVIGAVMNGVDQLASLTGRVASGGRLNVANAVGSAEPAPLTGGPSVTQVDWTGNSASQYDRMRLTFSDAIDAATFSAADVSISGPSGSVAVTSIQAVSGSNGLRFDVFFAAQSTAGAYSVSVGPDVRDAQTRMMDQNGNGTAGEAADRFQTGFNIIATTPVNGSSGNVNIPINDLQTAMATLTFGSHGTIADLNVTINIAHTRDSNLLIKLVSPNGIEVILSNRRGGTGDNYTGTTFDDAASTAISAGKAPFTGTFRPDGSLAAFNGMDLYGTWKLVVSDTQKRDVGTILNFSIAAAVTNAGSSISAANVTEASQSTSPVTFGPDSAQSIRSTTATLPSGITWIILSNGQSDSNIESSAQIDDNRQDNRVDDSASHTVLATNSPTIGSNRIADTGEVDATIDDQTTSSEIDEMFAGVFIQVRKGR